MGDIMDMLELGRARARVHQVDNPPRLLRDADDLTSVNLLLLWSQIWKIHV